MPDVSSADAGVRRPGAGGREPRAEDVGWGPEIARALPVSRVVRAVMLACGFIPLLHVACVMAPVVLAATGRVEGTAACLAPILLYLGPPLVVRLTTAMAPIPARPDLNSSGFLTWWFTAQWQVVFNRFPFLDELLRIVPGLYSLWLRLWGARIGALVYWSPGVTIVDRQLLRVGDRVVFGLGVRINGHVVAPGRDQRMTLFVAPITIGADSLIGGYSLLLPGCEIDRGTVTQPFRTVHPFTWIGKGQRRRRTPDEGPRA
jgi:hypothetical protein